MGGIIEVLFPQLFPRGLESFIQRDFPGLRFPLEREDVYKRQILLCAWFCWEYLGYWLEQPLISLCRGVMGLWEMCIRDSYGVSVKWGKPPVIGAYPEGKDSRAKTWQHSSPLFWGGQMPPASELGRLYSTYQSDGSTNKGNPSTLKAGEIVIFAHPGRIKPREIGAKAYVAGAVGRSKMQVAVALPGAVEDVYKRQPVT